MRDPRLNPTRGDVLRKGRFQRHITLHGIAGVWYRRKGVETPTANREQYSFYPGFRRWAADAEVIHVAEEGKDA